VLTFGKTAGVEVEPDVSDKIGRSSGDDERKAAGVGIRGAGDILRLCVVLAMGSIGYELEVASIGNAPVP